MEVRCKYRDLDWGETQPGWMWDVNLGGLDGIQTQPGWMWNDNLWTWMKVRWYMDGGWYNILLIWIEVGQEEDADEMQILKPGWVWYSVCMELRCDLDGSEMQYNGPAWSWNGTWMLVRWWYLDMDSVGQEQVRCTSWYPGGFRLSPEFILIYNSGDLVRDDIHLLGFGLVWDSTWMEVRCIYKGPHGVETLCGWKW